MSGFEIEGNQIVIRYGAREVATTGGTLLQFLTTEQTITGSVTFPNVTKTRLHMWMYNVLRAPGDNFRVVHIAQNAVGAPPQEWSGDVILAAVPSGADIFIGRIQIAQTVAPTHSWLGQPLTPVVPAGVQMSLNSASTILVEMAPGISRALTIDIEGGNLVAKLQQSVGPAAGNFGQFGDWSQRIPPNSFPPENVRQGAENTSASGSPALPIWWDETTRHQVQINTVGIIDAGNAILDADLTRWGGSQRDVFAPYSDPTNYISTYAITVRGRFGRRS